MIYPYSALLGDEDAVYHLFETSSNLANAIDIKTTSSYDVVTRCNPDGLGFIHPLMGTWAFMSSIGHECFILGLPC